MRGWGWGELHFGWVGVGGNFSLVGGCGWGYTLDGWGGRRFFMGRWGWVGVGGGIFWVGGVGRLGRGDHWF